jgi:glutathione S-transferase
MKLYDYAASANCYKVRLLLAQLEYPYERIPIDIFGGDTLTAEYAAKNPARSTPVLETDDGKLLPESNAILLYLADRTPFLPSDPFDLAQVVRWLLFEQTDVMMTMGGLRFRLLTGRLTPDSPAAVRRRAGAEEALTRRCAPGWSAWRSSPAT